MTINLQARNATLTDLAMLLKEQQAMKLDFVTPLANVTAFNGQITVAGTSVFDSGQVFTPTAIADGHLASKLGIPPSYLKTLRETRPDLYDANVNGWTQGWLPTMEFNRTGDHYGADERSVLIRSFINAGDPDAPGVLRAVLSERYGIIDNLDVLLAALDGVRNAGTEVDVLGCDLTESRMTIRVAAPSLLVHAPQLLAGYRSPFSGGAVDHEGGRLRTVPQWAQDRYGVNADGVAGGFVITNSETGGGAFTITPRLMVLTCTNGMMMTRDALRQVHLGGRLDEGVIEWSGDTQRKALELVTAQARDAVTTFLDQDYMTRAIERLTDKAVTPLAEPAKAIEFIGKQLAYSQEQQAGILDHFIRGGQTTAGGVLQAVTSYAQTVESPDTAYDLEASAVKAMELAAAR